MLIEQAKIEKRKVADLVSWEDNPRTVDKVHYKRLIEQIKYLGIYKPLLVNQNNIVLGGNMRLEAFKELGVEEVDCSIVLTDNPAQMMDYALSDNDQIGVTDTEKVAEYAQTHPIKSDILAINSTPMKLVSTAIKSLGPESGGGEPDSCRNCPIHCGDAEAQA